MIRSAVTVSLVPQVRGGPFVFWDGVPAAVEAARRLGFDAVEIFPPDAASLDGIDTGGFPVAAVGTGAGKVLHGLTLIDDGAKREESLAFVHGIIDAAGELGAPAIIGSMQGRHGPDATEAKKRLADALETLGDRAAHHGQPLLYEPLNRYETNMARTLAEGVELLELAGNPNVLLLADLFHMGIEEDDSAAALRAAGSKVGHVHFVDSNRKPAGFGQMDYAPIAEALRSIGYTRYLSAEAFSFPDAERAASKTIETFKRFFPR